jgi:hypothetical protein
MSSTHLDVLRQVLSEHQCLIVEELPGNDFDISGYWKIQSSDSDKELLLAFEGLDIDKTRPLQDAYGCYVNNNKQQSLYFDIAESDFSGRALEFVAHLME